MARAVEITDQGSFIPASQRPDGSWRKPRRVRDGYVPQEEVPLYESRGKQWANANSQSRQYPVGLDPDIIRAKEEAKTKPIIPGLVIENEGKKKKKKNKSSEGGVKEEPASKNEVVQSDGGKNEEWQTVQSKGTKAAKVEPANQNSAPVATDPAKKLKNLKKKLREIEVVEAKIASGEISKPDKDQIEKVNRKADILSEIFALELTVDK